MSKPVPSAPDILKIEMKLKFRLDSGVQIVWPQITITDVDGRVHVRNGKRRMRGDIVFNWRGRKHYFTPDE